jgi:hypothetical protein
MRVQQGYAFVGHTLLRPNSSVKLETRRIPYSPRALEKREAGRRGTPKVEEEMQTRTREIGAAEEAPLRTGGFRVPRLNDNYIFSPRGGWSGERSGHVRGWETKQTRLHCATGTCFAAWGGRYGSVVAWKGILRNRWRCYVSDGRSTYRPRPIARAARRARSLDGAAYQLISRCTHLREGENVTLADGNSLFLLFEAIDHDENFICADCGIDTH